MRHAVDLVREIRLLRPEISIAVAAYPEMHPESESPTSDLQRLCEKIAIGNVNFIITQFCFSTSAIIDFIQRCRSVGITIPIVVGLFVPDTYRSLVGMCRVCSVRVSDEDLADFQRLSEDPDVFRRHSIRRCQTMVKELMESGVIGFQFFTINKFDVVLDCLEGIDFVIE